MKPLLAHIYEPHRVTFPCYVQPKLNGIRALYQNGRFQSRDGIPFPVGLLDHLAKPLREMFRPETILDGELYVHGWPLQRINAAVTPVRQQPTEDTMKVEYHIFDRIDFTMSFVERYCSITGLAETTNCKLVKSWNAEDQVDADDFYAKFVSHGYEGMMYRLGDCPYTVPKQEWNHQTLEGQYLRVPIRRSKFLSDKNNRVWHMLKRKNWQDDEFLYDGMNTTTGDKGERGFQLWCKTREGKSFKVSSGLTEVEVDYYLEHPPIGQMIKVKYLVLSSDGIPLNATILAIL